MKTPVVSVITATFNRAHLVGGAISSVLAQGFADFELIVVDDGSCDNTKEIVATFDDPRIRYIPKVNAGLAAARNTGIEYAKGTYVTFLDDDDLYLPNCLNAHIKLMHEQPQLGWVSGGYRMTDLHGSAIGEHRPWESYKLDLRTWLFWCPTAPSAVMVKRDWLVRCGGFDPVIWLPDDWDMWLRLAQDGCPMAWVPEIVCLYRVHANNMVRNAEAMRSDTGIIRVLDKFFARPDLAPEIQSLRDKAYAHAMLKRATVCFRSGAVDAAVEDTLRAVELNSELLVDGGLPALEMLLGHAESPLVDDPYIYARRILDNLPEPPFMIRPRRSQFMGKVAAAWLFTSAKANDQSSVKRAFAGLMRYDPSWLRNSGVWSLMGTAMLGDRLMRQVRKASSRMHGAKDTA